MKIRKDLGTPLFRAPSLTIAKIFPSADERIKPLWDIYTLEYCSAVKKKEILPFMTAWMDLQGITVPSVK